MTPSTTTTIEPEVRANAAPPSEQFELPVSVDDERMAEFGQEILNGELSDYLNHWIERYRTVGERPDYLWKWCRKAVEITTLPCVSAAIFDDVCDTKTLGVMWDVMLDDLADQGGNPELLEELLALPLDKTTLRDERFTEDELAYGRFTSEIWDEVMARVASYPFYDDYAELLKFDYLQLCNVMRYSYLVNDSVELLNVTEHDLYTPHNMHIMVCSTVDLMVSPSFISTELGKLRSLTWNAQWMGRIGNLITTWEREIQERDFTSGVFALALDRGDLTVDDLLHPDSDRIHAAIVESEHEQYFIRKWCEHREALLTQREQFHSFDIKQMVSGLETLISIHMASRGRK